MKRPLHTPEHYVSTEARELAQQRPGSWLANAVQAVSTACEYINNAKFPGRPSAKVRGILLDQSLTDYLEAARTAGLSV